MWKDSAFPGPQSLKWYLVVIALRGISEHPEFDSIPVLVLAHFAYVGEIVQGYV